MKIFFLLLFILSLVGCESSKISKEKIVATTCPKVLFASEHRYYVDIPKLPSTLENITYKAEINNSIFSEGCFRSDNTFLSQLSILFVVYPEDVVDKDIFLPFYVAIIDSKDKLTNLEFYELNGEFNTQEDTENFIETELIKDISIKLTNSNDQITVILGFMLDNTKIELLN